ncbi:MAG: hypothetical protein ABIY55_04955 [Kofleriaceae bacterium]
MIDGDRLHRFLARLLGWSNTQAIDHALRSIQLAAAHRAHLVLCGDGDLVPIAYALHQRAIGANRAFIVCDPRRRVSPASVRSPTNHNTGVAAVNAARGGSLCVRSSRLPRDFLSAMAVIRDPDAHIQLVVCADHRNVGDALLVIPAPIIIPPLVSRTNELPRIVDECALDAVSALGADPESFIDQDRAWVMRYEASSLWAIEKATLRLVALRASASVSNAATRLGIAPVSLSRWIGRREIPGFDASARACRSTGVASVR